MKARNFLAFGILATMIVMGIGLMPSWGEESCWIIVDSGDCAEEQTFCSSNIGDGNYENLMEHLRCPDNSVGVVCSWGQLPMNTGADYYTTSDMGPH
jgi:hypothetical protein